MSKNVVGLSSSGWPYASTGYYEWLQSLKPGDRVALKIFGYRDGYEEYTVIENSKTNGHLLLHDGTPINLKTGRKTYVRNSYNDNGVHVLPITNEMLYDWDYTRMRRLYRDAVEKSLTINEMEQITNYINQIISKRKKHIPIVDSES